MEIGPNEDYGSLSQRCAEEGADLIMESVELISQGIEERSPQDDSRATFARLLNKDDLIIDWNLPAGVIRNRIRGLTPHPGARTSWEKGMLRIQEADCLDEDSPSSSPGSVLRVGASGIHVQTGDGVLRVLRLQPENKKPMKIKEFLNGYEVLVGSAWGSKRAG